MLMFSSFRLLRRCEISSPALEKSRSEGTEDAGMHMNFYFTRGCSLGNSVTCSLHHARGLSFLCMWGSSRYLLISMKGPEVD